jgi:hypothetical protein
MGVGCVDRTLGLSKNGDALGLQVFDGSVGASAIDGIDFVEVIAREPWHVDLAPSKLVVYQ